MKPIFLIRAPLRVRNLARWSAERGWIRRGGHVAGFDEGRALHHLLDELFGPRIVRPFRLLVSQGGRTANLYGYSEQDHRQLREAARIHGLPEHAKVIRPDHLDAKEMPADWTRGRRVGFDLRVRPVRRLKTSLTIGEKTFRKGSELDAFLLEALRRHPQNGSGMSTDDRNRESVYLDWLEARLGGAATLDREVTRLAHFQRVRASRGRTGPEGPDAALHGALTVGDPDLFRALISNGVGRHRAYGYGMLLLRPPGRKDRRDHA